MLLACWKYDSVDRPDFAKIVGQITAVIGMFPNRPVSDDQWTQLGGGPRDPEGTAPAAPARPKAQPLGATSAGGAAAAAGNGAGGARGQVANPFGNDASESSDSEPPSGCASPAAPASPPDASHSSTGAGGEASTTNRGSSSSSARVSSGGASMATGDDASSASVARVSSSSGGGGGGGGVAISPEIAYELGLLIDPVSSTETDETGQCGLTSALVPSLSHTDVGTLLQPFSLSVQCHLMPRSPPSHSSLPSSLAFLPRLFFVFERASCHSCWCLLGCVFCLVGGC
jgi:hypothetical protein